MNSKLPLVSERTNTMSSWIQQDIWYFDDTKATDLATLRCKEA